MRPIASRRAAVTSASLSCSVLSSNGGSFTSGSSSASASSAAAFFFLPTASAVAGSASDHPNVSASASAILLLEVLILVRPVLPFERPVFFVVAHQALELQGREQLGRVASLAQVRDLDLQLLLLADDGVDVREPRPAQQLAQPLVQVDERAVGDRAGGGDQ